MTAMTLLSRVLGLVREQVRAAYLGTGAASDAFGLASTVPNLFRRLLAEGAMTAAFIPVYAEMREGGDVDATRRFLTRFATLLTVAATLVTLVGVLASPWLVETFFALKFQEVEGKVELTVALLELMWPYLALVSVAALLQALLNAHRVFGPSAFTPVLLNLCIIGVTVTTAELWPDPSYALVAGFLLGGVLQIAFQVPYLIRWTPARFGFEFRRATFKDPGVRRVLTIMVPGVFAAGIYQVNVFVSQLIASTLDGGSIASLQYSVRLQELVLGLFVVSIAQVILPTLSDQTAKGDDDGVQRTLGDATALMAFVTLPATVGLVLVGADVVRLLFQAGAFDAESTRMTAFALDFHAAGLFAIALSRVYQQVFYAHKDLKTPTLVAAVSAIVNVVGCLLLSGPLGHGGIALAGSLAAAVTALGLGWLLRRRLGRLGGWHTLARVARVTVATALMTAAVLGFLAAWPGHTVASRLLLLVWVGCAATVGVVSYLVACRLVGVRELDGVLAAVLRRFRGRRARP